MEHVIKANDGTVYYYGRITKKFDPTVRRNRKGEEFTAYNFYFSVLGGYQFLEKETYNCSSPDNSKILSILVSVQENIHKQLVDNLNIVVRGKLDYYTTDLGEKKYILDAEEVFFNNPKSYVSVNDDINQEKLKTEISRAEETDSINDNLATGITKKHDDKSDEFDDFVQEVLQEDPFESDENDNIKRINVVEEKAKTAARTRTRRTKDSEKETVFINKAL